MNKPTNWILWLGLVMEWCRCQDDLASSLSETYSMPLEQNGSCPISRPQYFVWTATRLTDLHLHIRSARPLCQVPGLDMTWVWCFRNPTHNWALPLSRWTRMGGHACACVDACPAKADRGSAVHQVGAQCCAELPHLRMAMRSLGEGTPTSSSLSKRPGRRRARSTASGRFVAATTTTLHPSGAACGPLPTLPFARHLIWTRVVVCDTHSMTGIAESKSGPLPPDNWWLQSSFSCLMT